MKPLFCSLPWCSIDEHSLPVYFQNLDLRPRCLVLCLVRLRQGFAQILPELRKALGNRVFEDNNTDVKMKVRLWIWKVVDMVLLLVSWDWRW